MRTTVALDDDLLRAASAAIGTAERSVVIRGGLKALIQREAANRLIRLGGSVPDAQVPSRRRTALARSTYRKRT
ncbi:MAG TPA: type II toxin-antitoxin system VapB family antitoxin [Rhodanobacteraceae bacterium]